MEKLLWEVRYGFEKTTTDAIFINPRSYKIPRRDFHKVRAAIENLGLNLKIAWLKYSIVDSHDWYIYRDDENAHIGGWLTYARTDV